MLPHIVGSFTALELAYQPAVCVLLLRDVVETILEVSCGRRQLRAGILCSGMRFPSPLKVYRNLSKFASQRFELLRVVIEAG